MKKPISKAGSTDSPGAVPDFIVPAVAVAAVEPPSGTDWVHEIKHDGYRVQVRKSGGAVSLLTRRGLDWTAKFPRVARAFADLPAASLIVDGEMIVEDEQGVSSFSALVGSIGAKRWGVQAYVAFDLLYLDGVSWMGEPFGARKARLSELLATLPAGSPIRFGQHLAGDGKLILEQATKLGVEGIVSKRLAAPYRPGRPEWVKVKLRCNDEFVIAGYVPHAAASEAVGSLVLAFYDDGTLVYAGRVGTGYTQRSAAEIWQQLQPLRGKPPAFAKALDADQRREVVWLSPQLVAAVAYLGWTSDRLVRAAAFKGLRDDKPASTVTAPASYPL